MLSIGSPAPDFTAALDDGTQFHLADYRGSKNVVLYFYPADFTPGCTREACAFRDNYDEISKYDAIIVGVSGDSEAKHTGFREKHNLQFPLIADGSREVAGKYDAKGILPFMKPRVTYVIDKEGVIRAAMRHDLQVTRHVDEVIDALKSFAAPTPAA